MLFRDRREAGRALASELAEFTQRADVVVLALAPGGIPVGYEVSRVLGAPLDVLVIDRVGIPSEPGLAAGTVVSGGARRIDADVVRLLGLSEELLERTLCDREVELEERARAYRGKRGRLDLRDKIVLIVDDGTASGENLRAAVDAVRNFEPRQVIVAVAIESPSTRLDLESAHVPVICAATAEPFRPVGRCYLEDELDETELRSLLASA